MRSVALVRSLVRLVSLSAHSVLASLVLQRSTGEIIICFIFYILPVSSAYRQGCMQAADWLHVTRPLTSASHPVYTAGGIKPTAASFSLCAQSWMCGAEVKPAHFMFAWFFLIIFFFFVWVGGFIAPFSSHMLGGCSTWSHITLFICIAAF